VPPAPAAKPASASRPAAAPAAKKASATPWLLIALGLIVMLVAASALFWFVVRPRLKARFSDAIEVPVAEAPAADTSSAPTGASPVEPAANEPAPSTGPSSLAIGAPSRPGTTVSIDGGPPIPLAQAVTLQMAPGDHELFFAAPGAAPSRVRVAIAAGAAQSLEDPELPAGAPAATAAPRKPRKRVEAAPAPAPPAPEPEPVVVEPPPPPPVHRGDLVEFGPGVVRPKLLRPLSADYPAAAKRQRAEARIGVAVLIDENGKVTDARIAEGDGRGLGFEEVSLRAARAGAYQPATKNGVAVKMWHTVYITFRSK
jgi:TonB family protein